MQLDSPQLLVDDTTTAGYTYFCESMADNAVLTDAVWRVARLNQTTKRMVYAGGDSQYNKIAANRASLTYTES